MADSTEFKVKFIADMKDFKASIDKIRKDTKGLTDTIAKAKKSQTTKGAAADRASTRGAMASLKLERERLKVQQETVRLKERTARATVAEMRVIDTHARRERQGAAAARRAARDRVDSQGGGRGFMMGAMPGSFDPRRGRAPFAQRAGRFARGAGFAGAGGVAGWILASGMRSVGDYKSYVQTMGGTLGLGTGRQAARGMRGRMGSRLGYSMIDSAGHMASMAKATGVLGPRELQQSMRATGMGEGEAASMFGTMRQGGTTFTGAGAGRQSAGGKGFQRLLSMAVQSGLEKARRPEFLRGVQQFIAGENLVAGGKVTGQGFGRILAMLGKQGGIGFLGGRGANVGMKLHQGMRSPGGGEWGESFMRQAFGFGTPGGRTGFFQAERMREKGLQGKGGAGRLMQVMGHVQATTGGGDAGSYLLKQLTGVSMQQADKLQEIFASDVSSEEKLAKIEKVTKESKSLQKQSLEAMQGVGAGVAPLAALMDKSVQAGARLFNPIMRIQNWARSMFLTLVQGFTQVSGWLKGIFEDMTGPTEAETLGNELMLAGYAERKGMAAKTSQGRTTWLRKAYTRAKRVQTGLVRTALSSSLGMMGAGIHPSDFVRQYGAAGEIMGRNRRSGTATPIKNLSAAHVPDTAKSALEGIRDEAKKTNTHLEGVKDALLKKTRGASKERVGGRKPL